MNDDFGGDDTSKNDNHFNLSYEVFYIEIHLLVI